MTLYGLFYRTVMRVAHRFDWHYAPKIGPIQPGNDYQHWCKWCGLRATYVSGAEFAQVVELRKGDGRYYLTQERAFAPGIAGEWPPVILKPDSPHGRLVRRQWPTTENQHSATGMPAVGKARLAAL